MRTEEDEAFDDLAKRQGAWGGGFQAKRQMAADKLHWSDCAVHNGPAYPAGECDCGVEKGQEDWGALAEKQLASIKRDTQASFEDAMVRATHKVMAEFEAQPAQEPVAWAVVGDGKFGKYEIGRETLTDIDSANYWISRGYKLVSIYTTPPQRPWVGLTDEEIKDCLGPEAVRIPLGWSRLTRAIEAKLKEKNT